MDTTYVGIDVSKDRLDVHVCPSGEAFAVSRDGKGLEELVDRLRTVSPTLIAIEATGGFETIAAAAIAGAGLPLAVVNPSQVRHFAQALGKRAKTDPIDAEVIVRFAEAVRPQPRPVPNEEARLLGELVARRRQIIEMIVAERQREKRAENVRVRKSLARTIRTLEKELPHIDGDIDTLVRGSPAWRDKEDLLVTFPGVKNTLARTFLAEVPELGRLATRDREPCRPCSLHSSVRALDRQEHDRRRQGTSARCPLHGRTLGDPLQSSLERLLPTFALRW
jgi:transposase